MTDEFALGLVRKMIEDDRDYHGRTLHDGHVAAIRQVLDLASRSLPVATAPAELKAMDLRVWELSRVDDESVAVSGPRLEPGECVYVTPSRMAQKLVEIPDLIEPYFREEIDRLKHCAFKGTACHLGPTGTRLIAAALGYDARTKVPPGATPSSAPAAPSLDREGTRDALDFAIEECETASRRASEVAKAIAEEGCADHLHDEADTTFLANVQNDHARKANEARVALCKLRDSFTPGGKDRG